MRRPETEHEWAIVTCWVLFVLGYGAFAVVELRTGMLDLGPVDAVMGVATATLLGIATVGAFRND